MFKFCSKWERKMEELIYNVEIRDFLIRTKFNGCLRDHKLLSELHEYKFDGYSFCEVKDQIMDFDFKNIDKLSEVLSDLEYSQYILDTYRPIVKEKKQVKKNTTSSKSKTKKNSKKGR